MWPRHFPVSDYDQSAVAGLKLFQPRKGFRISQDTLLLFLSLPMGSPSVLDIGSGSGILSLLYARDNPASMVTGVDILEKNRELALVNAQSNSLSRVRFLAGDIRDYREEEPYHLIFSNPPYRKAGSGRLSPFPHKNIALYDSHLDFDSLFQAVRRLLSSQGLFFVVIWEGRRLEMLRTAMHTLLFPFVEMTYRGEKGYHHSFVVTGFSRTEKETRRVFIDYEEWSQAIRKLIQREPDRKGVLNEKM